VELFGENHVETFFELSLGLVGHVLCEIGLFLVLFKGHCSVESTPTRGICQGGLIPCNIYFWQPKIHLVCLTVLSHGSRTRYTSGPLRSYC
jgi:hypothetical protein